MSGWEAAFGRGGASQRAWVTGGIGRYGSGRPTGRRLPTVAEKDPLEQLRLTAAGLHSAPTVAADSGYQFVSAERASRDVDRSAAPADLPERLGRYIPLAELGRGGMGRVIDAWDPDLRRHVAIKLITSDRALDGRRLARFVAEAQISAQLEHPNIVPVHDVGLAPDGRVWFAMRKVGGRSLHEILHLARCGDEATCARWTRRALVSALLQVCEALGYAHDRGVLHRDVKPANIMFGRFGEVLLLDWGVARLTTRESDSRDPESAPPTASGDDVDHLQLAQTADGATVGTVGYSSPEQARGAVSELDARSDLFSLGAVLYEAMTLRPAYPGSSVEEIAFATMAGPPEDPRERVPELRISDELAEICMRALATERGARYSSAGALAAALRSFLDGRRRRQEAARETEAAKRAWIRHRELDQELKRLEATELELEQRYRPWTARDDKRPLLELQDRLPEARIERTRAFSELIGACERALSREPDSVETRALLADAFVDRLTDAEARGDREDAQWFEARARQLDDGRHDVYLRGDGTLSLITAPAGAEVVARRVERTGLVWGLGQPRSLGVTPLLRVPLPMGSWQLEVRARGLLDTVYPVVLGRARHWDSGATPIPLFGEQEIGDGWAYVPAGPFIAGGFEGEQRQQPRAEREIEGFLFRRDLVTTGEYGLFLTELHKRSPEEAWDRSPRDNSDAKTGGVRFWGRPGPDGVYAPPERDRDGDRWDPQWPAMGISWDDAMAYAAWVGERDGVPTTLPTEAQWEKAARGVDGRTFPWGDRFDATLCQVRYSSEHRPLPVPIASYPHDVSVYGMRDAAGTMREWCGDLTYGGDDRLRPVRGASWSSFSSYAHLSHRAGTEKWSCFQSIGFRLARGLPTTGRVAGAQIVR